MTSKRILVIGINFKPELTGIGKYTSEMVEWLSNKGYKCSIVTAFPYYPHWKVQSPYTGRFYKKEILNEKAINLYRCPLYVPQTPNGFSRIIHDASFFFSASMIVLLMMFKPKHDYIFCVAPPFHLGFLALIYRFVKGGKLIYHIQDLQVDAANDLKIIKSRRLINILFRLEKFILNRANEITTISAGMIQKIKNKTKKDVRLFPNWVDTDRFYPLADKDIRNRLGYSIGDKIVLYSGSIGEKQGLGAIMQVAQELKTEPTVKFLICGGGPYKAKLERMAEELDLPNILFCPLQPLEKLNEFLNIADVHLVLQKADVSDLAMPSKLSTILAVGGLAIVTADAGTGLHNEVSSHEIGLLTPADDPASLLKSVINAVFNDHIQIRKNARQYAEKFLSIDNVMADFLQDL